MDLLGCWLDVVALALMLTGFRFIPWHIYLGPRSLSADDDKLQLQDGIGFLVALLGLRLLVRRRFRRNRRASEVYSTGIRLMTLGIFVCIAAQLTMPRPGESAWLVVLWLLMVLLGFVLMTAGYVLALTITVFMACEVFDVRQP